MLLFGPPGSGKGTQASRIRRVLELEHISTGDILRAESASGTDAGRRLAAVMAAGDLVSDDVILDLVRRRLADMPAGKGCLFDGFPRTVEQARALDALLAESGRRVDDVIALRVPEPELVDRILRRAGVEGRPDDTREAIAERMREYRLRTAPVLDRYRSQGVCVWEVDGTGSPEEVFTRVRQAISARAN